MIGFRGHDNEDGSPTGGYSMGTHEKETGTYRYHSGMAHVGEWLNLVCKSCTHPPSLPARYSCHTSSLDPG